MKPLHIRELYPFILEVSADIAARLYIEEGGHGIG